MVYCLDHTVWGSFCGFAVPYGACFRTCSGRFPFGVGVNELTSVTSNVNGWLPVQDGGTWWSDTDSYITNLILDKLLWIVCVWLKRLLSFLSGLGSLKRCVPLVDLGGVTVLCLQFSSPVFGSACALGLEGCVWNGRSPPVRNTLPAWQKSKAPVLWILSWVVHDGEKMVLLTALGSAIHGSAR